MFYHQIVMFNGLPFDARIPNPETVQAMKELKNPDTRKNLSNYSGVKELMDDLES